jgi:hypothetical protein
VLQVLLVLQGQAGHPCWTPFQLLLHHFLQLQLLLGVLLLLLLLLLQQQLG